MDSNQNTRFLENCVSPQASQLTRHVKKLALELLDKTEATPFAADTLILANEVATLCDYVDHLHDSAETFLAKSEATSSSTSAGGEPTATERKAVQIQQEIHQFNPGAKDIIKALFMWRDSPEQRLRDGK